MPHNQGRLRVFSRLKHTGGRMTEWNVGARIFGIKRHLVQLMNSESEQIWRWYFHLTDHFLIFVFAPQLCKRTFLTLESASTSYNPCLDDMRLLQQIQCQDNLGITWTLFNLVYKDFIHENTCTIMEYLPVSSILCVWGGRLILSTTCASGLFVYICLFEICVQACM